MTTTNVNRKLIFSSNIIPNIEKNVKDIIYLNNSCNFIIDEEYYNSLKFNNDYNINNNNYININFNFNIIN